MAVLEARYATLTRRLQEELAGAPPAERMAAVTRQLSEDGYMAEATATPDTGTLIEHNCAIQAVARAVSGDLCGRGQVPCRRPGRGSRSPGAHLERLQRLRVPGALQRRLSQCRGVPSQRRTYELVGRNAGQQGVQIRLRHRYRSRYRAEGPERRHRPPDLGQEGRARVAARVAAQGLPGLDSR